MGGWYVFVLVRIYAIYNIRRQTGSMPAFEGKRCNFFFDFYCGGDMGLILAKRYIDMKLKFYGGIKHGTEKKHSSRQFLFV